MPVLDSDCIDKSFLRVILEMNILAVNPPFKEKFSRNSRSPAVTKGGTIYYPIWLSYAVGVLDSQGFNVRLVDCAAQNIVLDGVVDIAKQVKPRLIIVDTSTPSIYSDVETAGLLKDACPDSFVILVGTHPSAVSEGTLRLDSRIDAVAVREYDYTIRDLAVALRDKQDILKVAGIVSQKDSKILIHQERGFIKELDTLPFVSAVYKKHLNVRDYFFAAADYPMVMIMTGRGCPYRCFFCVYPQVFNSHEYRLRSAENVVEEFVYVKTELPEVQEIGIEDDTFTADKERVREICGLLIKRKIKMRWYCNSRVDLDLDMLTLMRSAGCRLMAVGFESGSQNVLNGMRKGITLDQTQQFVQDARKAGILIHGCFMIGNPGDTRESVRESFALAKRLNCDTVQFYPLIVYPGTAAFKWAKENNYLVTELYNEWLDKDGKYSCVVSMPDLSSRQVMDICEDFTRGYYFRFVYIARKLTQMFRHPREIRRTFFSFISFVRHIANF